MVYIGVSNKPYLPVILYNNCSLIGIYTHFFMENILSGRHLH